METLTINKPSGAIKTYTNELFVISDICVTGYVQPEHGIRYITFIYVLERGDTIFLKRLDV